VTPAGYSGKQTWEKLGLQAGESVVVIGAPSDYAKLIGGVPPETKISSRISGNPEMVHLFATEKKVLERHLKSLRSAISQDGAVWVSWPKKSAKVETDISEDAIREVALPMGYVDVKVCAVNEIWSGLKLVIRKSNRG
jgi:cell fate regulator YaaT (PSP1 superfamily)